MATTKVSKGLIKDGAVTIEKLNNALVVTEAEGIVNNDNDITVPTSAAVKDYVDSSAVTDSNFVFIDVKNETGSTIPLGTGCMAVGTDGNSGHILIAPMIADGSVEPKYFIGVLEEEVLNGGFGRVVTQGEVNQINTNAFLDGDVLWCDPANPGGFTKTEPLAPNLKISTAIVLNASTNGKIFVRAQGNEGLHELHDVGIASQTDKQVLAWNNTAGYWQNQDNLYSLTAGTGLDGGTITTSGTISLADAAVTYNKLGAEFTDVVVLNSANSSLDIDFSLGTSFTLLADQGNFYTLTFTNYNIGDVKSISCTVASTFGLSFNATGKTIVVLNGEIDPNVDLNFIQVVCVDTNTFYLTISSLTP